MHTPSFLSREAIEARAAFFDVPHDTPSTNSCISVYKAAGQQMNSVFHQFVCSPEKHSETFEQALTQFELALAVPYSPLSHQSLNGDQEEHSFSGKKTLQDIKETNPFGLSRRITSGEMDVLTPSTPITPTKTISLSAPLKITPIKESSTEEEKLIHTGREYLADISHQQSLQFLNRSEQNNAEIHALLPTNTLAQTATRLIQKALLLMDANNVEKKGFLTYHTRFHAAEMVMDTLKTLTASAQSWSLPLAQKKLLILVGILCAAYHDAYFRGGTKRGIDEATCAEILAEELKAPPSLRSLIYALIVGGTLPTFSGKGERPIMLPIASDARFVDQDIRAHIPTPLKEVIATLGQMDVHRTEKPNLRDQKRIKAFENYITKQRKLCGPSLNGVHVQLKRLARNALKKAGYHGSVKQIEEWVNGLLDKMGQNFRTCLENSFFLTLSMETQLPSYHAYLEMGRRIARGGEHPLPPDSKMDTALFPAFKEEARFAHFLNHASQYETGQSTSLWAVHIEWMNAISSAFAEKPAKQSLLLEYALLRAGCQDGVVFASTILSKDFDVMREIDRGLSPAPASPLPFATHRLSAVAPATPKHGDTATSTAAVGAEVGSLYSPPR